MSSAERYVACAQVLTSDLGEEVALMHRQSGVYFGLDAVGATVWRHLQSPLGLEELVHRVTEEYEVDAERCRQDLLRLLSDLSHNGLIERA